MDEFIQEICETATDDLLMILQDQLELYSEEELACICQELESRSTIDVSIGMKKMNRVFNPGSPRYASDDEEDDEIEEEEEIEEWLEMDEDDGLF